VYIFAVEFRFLVVEERSGALPMLNKEIDDVLSSKQLPSHLAGDIDAIRTGGEFRSAPNKWSERI
jgi:hypothetical protein